MRTRQLALILMLVFLLGIFAARLPAQLGATPYSFLDPLIEVYRIIDSAYVDKPDQQKLQTAAINGMLESLDDPYTQYIPPSEKAAFEKDMKGQFVGIGAEVNTQGGYLTIVSPLEDSPAYNAGIKAGDRVLEIEGKTTLNVPIDECISLLTGKPGDPVNILVERSGQKIPFTIIREKIVVKAVKGVRRNGGGKWDYSIDHDKRIGYVRLTQFIPTAARELAEALNELKADAAADQGGLNGLILDLRGDPGGVLDQALEIADMFLTKGVIVSVKGRAGQEESHEAREAGTLPDFPLIVLVNGQSASASEIVAGALSDHARAVIVGTRSFGKGLVQAVQPLRRADGAQLKFTAQRYYLPSGRLIQRTDTSVAWGVDPSPGFYVPMTEDEQIARLLTRRDHDILSRPDEPKAGDAPQTAPAEENWSDPAWIERQMKDKQLAAAVKAMQIRLQSGAWAPVSTEAEQPEKINLTELHQLELGRERLLREIARVDRRIDALDAAAAGDAKLPGKPIDLWPNDINLTGGKVEVFDKDGKRISTLNITGPNLERWLIDADVKPTEEPKPAEGSASDKDKKEPRP